MFEGMTTILDLSYIKAQRFFMQADNYCNMSLPAYIDFQPVLDYAQSSIGKKDLNDCLKKGKDYPSHYDGVNYLMLVNKDGKYAYRPMQLANPFLYYLLVREITSEHNWNALKDKFKEFKDEHIEVPSIPVLKEDKDKTSTATAIINWWNSLEQRSIELSMTYKYMFITDITNCYGCIYTHSISWALLGKDIAKSKIGKNSLGNTIDKYMRSMQYGQTNGIPQGGVVFDFIAEIVLGYADRLLADSLATKNIKEYKILRYRDDYRIFSNSREELNIISLELQKVLADLNFHMNVSKTRLTESIIEDSIKPDKYYYIQNIPAYKKNRSLFTSFQKELFYILSIAKKYPNSGTVCRLMTQISWRIEKRKEIKENIRVLAAICLDIAMTSPKIYQQALACISNLIERLESKEDKVELMRTVYKRLRTLPNIGHIQLWMQRLTYAEDKAQGVNPYTEPLCDIIYGNDITLWNNDWLKEEFTRDFPLKEICNTEKRKELTSFIKTEEVDVFEY